MGFRETEPIHLSILSAKNRTGWSPPSVLSTCPIWPSSTPLSLPHSDWSAESLPKDPDSSKTYCEKHLPSILPSQAMLQPPLRRLQLYLLRRGEHPGRGRRRKIWLSNSQKVILSSPQSKPCQINLGHMKLTCTSFLKRRVLPVLQSQRLIHIKPVREESTSKAHTQFVWHISDPIHDLIPSTQFPNLRPWDPAEHWDRLIAGVHPAETAADLNTLLEKRDEAKKEKAYADGREKRPEREIWRWEGREPELTTRLERLHLNRRKQRARPGKERKWMALRKGMETRRAEAREIVRKEIEEGRRAAEAGKLKRLKIEEDKSASNLP